MSEGLIALILIGAPLGLYVLVRIAGAAWYKSKHQFDNQPKGM